MNFSLYIPSWLDTFLVAPFRWPSSAYIGFWLGCAFLAIYSIAIGELIRILLMAAHRRYYSNLNDKTLHYHKLSMKALHCGEKEAYFAANRLAHDNFGKSFFAKASVSMAMLLPVPLCLAWLSLRFEGVEIYTIPFTEKAVGYVFVFLISYIILRIAFAKVKKRFK